MGLAVSFGFQGRWKGRIQPLNGLCPAARVETFWRHMKSRCDKAVGELFSTSVFRTAGNPTRKVRFESGFDVTKGTVQVFEPVSLDQWILSGALKRYRKRQ